MEDFEEPGETTVRADSYFIARTQGHCGCCFRPTPLLGLALPRDHETWYDADPEDYPFTPGYWQIADGTAFIFYIERLSPEVARRVKELSAHFLPEKLGKNRSGNWVNHCARCGSALDDTDPHCELDGPFVPSSAAAAGLITLIRRQEPLLATASGYSFEPEFFAAMRRG
jgi:hypothetical protein